MRAAWYSSGFLVMVRGSPKGLGVALPRPHAVQGATRASRLTFDKDDPAASRLFHGDHVGGQPCGRRPAPGQPRGDEIHCTRLHCTRVSSLSHCTRCTAPHSLHSHCTTTKTTRHGRPSAGLTIRLWSRRRPAQDWLGGTGCWLGCALRGARRARRAAGWARLATPRRRQPMPLPSLPMPLPFPPPALEHNNTGPWAGYGERTAAMGHSMC